MPVRTIAMKRLEGKKRTFYMDEHGPYRHVNVDFYPADLVENIIADLSNQVLEERKKWACMFDYFKAKRKGLRDARHAAVVEKDRYEKELAELKADYDEVRGRLQTANLIKDEQKEKEDKLLSCLRCLVMRDLIKDCPEKDSAIEIIKGYSL